MKSLPPVPLLTPNGLQPIAGISFAQTLADYGLPPLTSQGVETLQINVGKICNQTCRHCHVDAGPHRTEIMTLETMDTILAVLRRHPEIQTVDLTGGAPEMNPHFEYLVSECRTLDRHVLDRCNLTIFFVKGKHHLPQFLADHHVEIIASLPCYSEANVDQQRGRGVFERSIMALRQLNQLGYGIEGSGLALNLVYNPLGPKLPPNQRKLEADYKEELGNRFGISFNRLYTITNMPISRFLDDLRTTGRYEEYMELLANSFNPASVDGLMCRKLISIGWDGQLYDCDFNQMLDIPILKGMPQTITDFGLELLSHRPINTDHHCFGCTAGAGSSCGGAIA